ncbi:MAG: hypothetical protein JWP14_21 [Frankiales bacterium]|nr:hypothetical protein [Frankiales bacterium]
MMVGADLMDSACARSALGSALPLLADGLGGF